MKINPGFLVLTALLVSVVSSPVDANLAPLTIAGSNITAGGQPITLRGINWGWWGVPGTHYTEEDMRKQAAWGTNVVRLPVTYSDFVDPVHPGIWLNDGFARLEEVLHWAKKYNQYVVIDMHVVPGGQDGASYCDHGKDLIWTDAASQSCFLALWSEMARRYRTHSEVAAYELLNEPDSGNPTPDALTSLCGRAITTIRRVDPDKIIVVPGDHWSPAASLVDALKLPDSNILYTFHFYEGTGFDHWVSNDNNGPGISGTNDWTHLERLITVPAGVTSMRIMLRSSRNSGTAWFDDVVLTDVSTKTVLSYPFDTGPSGFQVERTPGSVVDYDDAVGHEKPGSLRVRGTLDYNGWVGPRIPVTPGSQYNLSAWVKLTDATGNTYLSAAFSAPDASVVDKDDFRRRMEPAAAFSKKFKVPVWVGEFGCGRDSPSPEFQIEWVRNCIELFEESHFNWTYWNYRETTGPDSMALHAESKAGADYPVNEQLLSVLTDGWKLNAKRD